MKKIIFLISLCLLSQNISIALEEEGYNTGVIMPSFVPQTGTSVPLPRTIFYSNSTIPVIKEETPPPMPKIKAPAKRLEKQN